MIISAMPLAELVDGTKLIAKTGVEFELALPHEAFHRQIGVFAAIKANPAGDAISQAEWEAQAGKWLPTKEDGAYIQSLMVPCFRAWKIRVLDRGAQGGHRQQAR